MLESLAAWVLNTYVGEYVENLNTDQLSIALLQGAVELEYLPLKKDALKSLGLPLVVKSGFIGKITLQIPIRRLHSEPWVISMERLYVVAGPVQDGQYDEKAEKEAEEARKAAMLAEMEEKWQLQKSDKVDTSWFSYGASVATNILENLQLKIKDVHIRYEDDQVNPSCPVAFGVVIKELSAQSTDGQWVPRFVSGASVDMMHKLVDLRNFAMYFDTNTTMVGELSRSQMADSLQREMYVSSITNKFKEHEYILSPVTAEAKMKRNTSVIPLRSQSSPRITIDLSLQKMAFNLIDDQYRSMVLLMRELDRKQKQKKHRHLRPSCVVHGNSTIWWKFAILARLHQIQEQNKRKTWNFVLNRAKDIVTYYYAYKTCLLKEPLYNGQKAHKEKMEKELSFDELKILRELACNRLKREGKLDKRPSPTTETAAESPVEVQNEGVLQRWFPAWGGWYSAQPSKSDSGTDIDDASEKSKPVDTAVGEPPPKISKTELEQELTEVIEDVMGEDDQSVLKRDTVFATLNFCLDSGSFKLQGTKAAPPYEDPQRFSLLELECKEISVLFESRPRSKGMKFGIGVGSLELKDKITENTVFPVLVGSQNKDKFGPSRFSPGSGNVKPSKALPVIVDENGNGKLFELLYEKNPAGTTAHYRFKIKTKPLDMVYNRTAIDKAREFFSTRRLQLARKNELNLTAIARRRYETLKRQTQEELKQTLEQLLEGADRVQVKRWEINLDISAPQIIIPEKFNDRNTSLVVLDLGNIRVKNLTPLSSSQASSQTFNDDDFHTPMSTPPNESLDTDLEMTDLTQTELTESQFYDKLYDKYTLDLADLQVMVGKMEDNWRNIHHRGSSQLHLVDRFSITLQLERRLLNTSDPQWPSVTVSATLPHLTVHVNEHKVKTINSCIQTMSSSTSQQVPASFGTTSLRESASSISLDEVQATSSQSTPSTEGPPEIKGSSDMQEDSQLLLMQFTIHHVALEIHSRDRAVAELQVSGVKTHLRKRPYDTSVTLTVHSLLVVDALQSYGSDFELLVASHKNLTLDSASGSIRDSGPCSPTSPTSPRSPPSSPMETLPTAAHPKQSSFQSVQDTVTRAVNSIISGSNTFMSTPSGVSGKVPGLFSSPPDSEALITLDLEMISAKAPSNTSQRPLNIANFQFNNLDVIGNQETLVEILSFLKRAVPSSKQRKQQTSKSVSMETTSNNENMFSLEPQIENSQWELTADFNRLSVLLMRLDTSSGTKTAKKVATVTMSCAHVQATLDADLSMSGGLGGFHVLDIKPDVQRHQRVFSIGHDTTNDGFPPHDLTPRKDMYKTCNESMMLDELNSDSRAFSFKLTKPRKSSAFDRNRSQMSFNDTECLDKGDNCVNVIIRMSSLCYTHSPSTVHELSQCMSEFKEYMSSVGNSLKMAASVVAKGMVTKRQDALHTSMYGSNHSLDFFPNSQTRQFPGLDKTQGDLENITYMEETELSQKPRIVLDASFDTPVIVIPQSATSSRVFVANLGNISLVNKEEDDVSMDKRENVFENDQRKERILMEIENMNLYSLDLDDFNAASLDSSLSYQHFNTDRGTPIMHNTSIQVTINHIVPEEDTNPDVSFPQCPSSSDTDPANTRQPVLDFCAKIQTPVKMVLSKQVYEQLLKTTDNLSYVEAQMEQTPDTTRSESPTSPIDSSTTLKDEADSSTGFSRQSSFSQQKPSSVFITKKLKLEVPKFSVELCGDFGEGEQGLVELSLYNFLLEYLKDNQATTNVNLSLKSLIMDDLLEAEGSPHRQIMVSKAPKKDTERQFNPKEFLSSSCPDNAIETPVPTMPMSLPSSFHENLPPTDHRPSALIGQFASSGTPRHHKRSNDVPCTPPPSPFMSQRMSIDEEIVDEHLVHIALILVDKTSPEYTDKYNKTKRFIDVDFNCLDTKINLQTWVVLLDFLGLGAKVHDVKVMQQSEEAVNKTVTSDDEPESANSEIKLKVENLSIILNKPEYEFAQASISKLASEVSLRDGNFAMKGQLGNMSLLDLSPNGQLYRERFITVGQQAMEFDLFKYGIPDPWLHRDYDMRLKLRMASVRYIHTNRFHSETLGFVQHFLQLQDVLGRSRAASLGKQINETAFHSARLLLDIEAGAPIILIPHSSRTTDVMVADLGTLTVKNFFCFDGDPQTFRHTEKNKNNSSPSSSGETMENGSLKPSSYRGSSQTMEVSSTPQSPIPSALTQSLFDELEPPRTNLDPMTDSIYGGLEMDLRNQEIYDPTDIPISPVPDGSSVDPISARSCSEPSSPHTDGVAGKMSPGFSPFSTSSTLASTPSQRSSSKLDGPGRSAFACNRVSPDGEESKKHVCLLEMMEITLSDMDLYAAERMEKRDYKGNNLRRDLEFPSCIMQRQGSQLLKEKCVLNLKVERNLEGEISHAVPDWRVQGAFSSVHCCLDVSQYKLIRGVLEHNLGEKMEVFKKELMTHMQDPKIQTVLSGDVWAMISMSLDLNNVTVELIKSHKQGSPCLESSLAKLDFIRSCLSYDTFSDQSKEVDLVSHEIQASDTRFIDAAVNQRSSVFEKILRPSKDASPDSLQIELHYRATPVGTCFKVLLNNMKLMCVFDWLLLVQEFLMTKAENPFLSDQVEPEEDRFTRQDSNMSTGESGSRTCSPLTASGGIITKRGPIVQQTEVPFEFKLNVTDTQFVVLENMAASDTSAVVLKCTAVMSFRPKAQDKLLSCTLQSLEVFSCCLQAEEDTAMSIVDPMTITVELNANPLPDARPLASSGLLEAKVVEERNLLLEVNFSVMNIRLSYLDMKMFLAIMNSLPKQALNAKQSKSMMSDATDFSESQLKKLQDMGFRREDCVKALTVNGGKTNEAAIWLSENAVIEDVKKNDMKITLVEVKSSCLCVCLIDDCLDADVPLMELSFHGVKFNMKLKPNLEGKASFQLLIDYYNRALSGWEPVVEPWWCHTDWRHYDEECENKFALQVTAPEVLNVNLTRTLIEQYNRTKVKWTEDYYKQDLDACTDAISSITVRRRQPFTPYVIRNLTGSPLWFITVTTSPSSVGTDINKLQGERTANAYIHATDWKNVPPNEDVPFIFYRKEKIRHKKSHSVQVNQLVVKVEGWQRLSPVSVDKVGVYFRKAFPDRTKSIIQVNEHQAARMVFDVSQEGTARKVITIRSALVVHNKQDSTVEVKMDSPIIPGRHEYMSVESNHQKPVPLSFVHSKLFIRAMGWDLDFCNHPLDWHHVQKPGEIVNNIKTCFQEKFINDVDAYRFCVAVKRELYPEEPIRAGTQTLPGHTLTIMPPVTIVNQLPIDMNYYLKGTKISGAVKSGKEAQLHAADLNHDLELGVLVENFICCRELFIPTGTSDYRVKIRLYDSSNRSLELHVHIQTKIGGSVRLSISCKYWLVNKSGLPLIFRQDYCAEAAGQFEEHELARSVTPLLFSFVEKEMAYQCTMRVGKAVHGEQGSPHWCSNFTLDSGVGCRQLYVSARRVNRPDWKHRVVKASHFNTTRLSPLWFRVYNIGIEVQQGKGKFRNTKVVTFAPRYEIDNQSSHKLAIAQRHFTNRETIPNPDGHLTALPTCKLPFHWPRLDLDQLLCVLIKDKNKKCYWSGGFKIDKISSFHINMRDERRNSILLKVEVILKGPTYQVIFTDAEQMPPPFRIDNLSEVPLLYYQTKTSDEKLRATIKPHISLPYAWDEPTLDPYITLSVPNGTVATYNLDKLEEGEQLCYQNFIYITATATFPKVGGAYSDLQHQELVLDCQHDNHVVFKKKETGKRSQLWRMTGDGMLEHEGQMPPRDPRKSSSGSTHRLVLDIADIALQPGKPVPLMLKKVDERRRVKQSWTFTETGMLCCSTGNLCVQAVDGVSGLQNGAIAVLGPGPVEARAIPLHMLTSRRKLHPGSGCLTVRVMMDGPIRVLQIADIQQRNLRRVSSHTSDDWEMYEESLEPPGNRKQTRISTRNIELSVNLKGGIGISLVNSTPEELMYIALKNIALFYTSSPSTINVELSVANIQADNQLFGTPRPIMLFVTPTSKKDFAADNAPALHIAASRVPNNNWNAEIYKHLIVSMKKMTLQLEERLLWKLIQFFGYQQTDQSPEKHEEQTNQGATSAEKMKCYYFGLLKVKTNCITLSMLTASRLPPDLKAIKRAMSIPLIRFEDANVDLDPFIRYHPFETRTFIMREIMNHYTEELKSQAAKILGSVDFLGNPLGLFNDVTEGISGLIKDGNLGGLVKNVVHGISNSTAKMTGAMSDGLGKLNDSRHNDMRESIKNRHSENSGGHLVAGIKGFGHGIWGGAVSMVTQSYDGAKEAGLGGFIVGLTKGVVGTVTRPATGVLDLATGAANAIKDGSQRRSHMLPSRAREPRCCYGQGGLLPPYSKGMAETQDLLFKLNNQRYDEFLIALEQLRYGAKDCLRALITSKQVYFLQSLRPNAESVLLKVPHSNLYQCKNIENEGRHYIEMVLKGDASGSIPNSTLKRPQVRCDKQVIAQKVAQQVNYAKNLYDEQEHTLFVDNTADDSMD